MKACIFDLDGTLTDTLESLAYSVKATLREVLPYTGVYLMKIVHIM